MNNFNCIGRVGRDAEIKRTSNGNVVTSFSVAVDAGYGDNKTTVWLDCSRWGESQSKVADYIKKGDLIGLTGELSVETFVNNDGAEKTKLKLNVSGLKLLGSKDSSSGSKDSSSGSSEPRSARESPPKQASSSQSPYEDDIPF